MKTKLEETIKIKIKEKLDEKFSPNKDGMVKIFTDYRDRELSKDTLSKFVESDNPREAFSMWLNESALEYEISLDYEDMPYGYIEENIKEFLTEEEVAYYEENRDLFREYISDNCYFAYDENDFNVNIHVNIMVDTGAGNYDFTKDNVLNYYGTDGGYSKDGYISSKGSLYWLACQQGKGDALIAECKNYFKDDYTPSEDNFIKSCVQEYENLTSHMGTLTFLVDMPLFDYFAVVEAKKAEEKGYAKYCAEQSVGKAFIKLGKTTECGLFDTWSGAGSCLEVELDKDVYLPLKYIDTMCIDGCKQRGYDVDEVYGLMGSCWKESFDGLDTGDNPVPLTLEEELLAEQICDVLNKAEESLPTTGAYKKEDIGRDIGNRVHADYICKLKNAKESSANEEMQKRCESLMMKLGKL